MVYYTGGSGPHDPKGERIAIGIVIAVGVAPWGFFGFAVHPLIGIGWWVFCWILYKLITHFFTD